MLITRGERCIFDTEDFKGDYLATFTRYNSGKHFLDSGDYYGRQYERDISDNDFYFDEYSGFIINTHEMVRQNFEHLYVVQDMFHDYCKLEDPNNNLSYFTLTERFVNILIDEYGFNSEEVRDNTYNNENDLDQDMIIQVLTKSNDWVWNDNESIMIINFHTGCDIRGGYSPPLFVQSKTDYNWPLVRSRLTFCDKNTLNYVDEYDLQEISNYDLMNDFEIIDSSDVNNVIVKRLSDNREFIVNAYADI